VKPSKGEKALRRIERWKALREKRYKGDHRYWMLVAQGWRLLPWPIVVEPGIACGMRIG
jgi:hypothetical protein